MRLLHESDYWQSTTFATLTYNEESLPATLQLEKRALQLFFKKLRRRGAQFKYYACGEYGDVYGRPHYHAILFGLGISDQELINECWGLGYVYLGTVTYDSCRYVADYVQKKLYGTPAEKKQQPFSLTSRGLGLQYALDNKTKLTQNLYETCRGKKTGIPKYYVKKLEIDTEALLQAKEERNAEITEHYENKYGTAGNYGIAGYLSSNPEPSPTSRTQPRLAE